MNVELSKDPQKGITVISNTDYEENQFIAFFEGYEVSKHSAHSITLEGKIWEGTGPLKYLSHSCDPNSIFLNQKRDLFALKKIKKGEELTINYLSTENQITSSFNCSCGAINCSGFIG